MSVFNPEDVQLESPKCQEPAPVLQTLFSSQVIFKYEGRFGPVRMLLKYIFEDAVENIILTLTDKRCGRGSLVRGSIFLKGSSRLNKRERN